MAKIVIELTNRCNLRCQHCFSGRHGGRDDLPMIVLEQILDNANDAGFDLLSFTGGDPTLHRQFEDILRMTSAAGYRYSINTNGFNFTQIYPLLIELQSALDIIVFSLDGATEEIHDQLRGKGSFRRVMQAMSICTMMQLPFAINMVITAHNRHELRQMAEMGRKLGAKGVRYGHLMPSPDTTDLRWDLSLWQRKLVETEIRTLRHDFPLPLAIAPGYHSTDPFPCTALHLQEVNVDCMGNLTKCCHLSGHGEGVGEDDIIGNLQQIPFGDAIAKLKAENEQHQQAKLAHFASAKMQDSDFVACWYCANYYKKVGWLKAYDGHPWQDAIWQESPSNDRAALRSSQPIELVEAI